jgi:succinate dehydrogenase hydrophobic anchor subunit
MSAAKSRTLSLAKRGMSFETFMWAFTRLSALAMYGFILIGLIGAVVMGARNNMNFADVMRWALMPNVTHVENTNLPDLAPWATAFWKLVASGLFLTASAHGVHGLVVIADDYIVSHSGRQFVRLLSGLAILAMSGMGLYIIWTS